MLNPKLKDILCCPQCKGTVQFETNRILCKTCNLQFPIKNNIPVMLISEAKNIKG